MSTTWILYTDCEGSWSEKPPPERWMAREVAWPVGSAAELAAWLTAREVTWLDEDEK